MKFIAKPNASQRTKNRIREHNGEFEIKSVSHSVPALNDVEGMLLQGENGWLGWLPVHEIRVDIPTECFGGFGQEIERDG